ncbi:MAG TPA: NAD(P)/FAD-dependent oxidoreductase [Steroidobacteraceae bacterium]|nr:NAD(P)/FAD-dependent oxidoreductase [Steroidobacteraceae bacterium]
MTGPVTVLGAGLSGALMAICLARQGYDVCVLERRPDLRKVDMDAGRSINLALADRGIEALREAGVYEDVAPLLIPMRGRMLHAVDGALTFAPYGQRPHEVIHSVSRPGLTRVLLDHARRHYAIEPRFLQAARTLDFERDELVMLDEVSGDTYVRPLAPLIAADGAGSVVRRALSGQRGVRVVEDMLEHGYKELTLPARAEGGHALEREALHVWPRGGFMLIALPNLDGSFTVTLFLALRGPESFAELSDRTRVEAFFGTHFADVVPLMPNLAREFFEHPVGRMGTVYVDEWAVDGAAVLLGDAAHAIVPFHGQGMNACFEDCRILAGLLREDADWGRAFTRFTRERKPNTDAIAAMALENFLEMRDTVRDPKFMLRKALSFELERRHPDRFIPRYSMVMFHHEVPYAVARARGEIQAGILAELTADVATLEEIAPGAMDAAVLGRLEPLPQAVGRLRH